MPHLLHTVGPGQATFTPHKNGSVELPMADLWGSANYTMGLSGTVWPLHMGAGMPENEFFF